MEHNRNENKNTMHIIFSIWIRVVQSGREKYLLSLIICFEFENFDDRAATPRC